MCLIDNSSHWDCDTTPVEWQYSSLARLPDHEPLIEGLRVRFHCLVVCKFSMGVRGAREQFSFSSVS